MANFKKLAKQYEENAILALQEFVAKNSVYDEKSITPDAPYGKGVKSALDYIAKLGNDFGFKVDKCDGHATELTYGEGNGPLIGIYAHSDGVNIRSKPLYLGKVVTKVDKGIVLKRLPAKEGDPKEWVRVEPLPIWKMKEDAEWEMDYGTLVATKDIGGFSCDEAEGAASARFDRLAWVINGKRTIVRTYDARILKAFLTGKTIWKRECGMRFPASGSCWESRRSDDDPSVCRRPGDDVPLQPRVQVLLVSVVRGNAEAWAGDGSRRVEAAYRYVFVGGRDAVLVHRR